MSNHVDDFLEAGVTDEDNPKETLQQSGMGYLSLNKHESIFIWYGIISKS